MPAVTDRDPVNELYDRGCDLVEAAAAIRRAAGTDDVARAAPAVLGCIETALEELAAAAGALGSVTHRALCEEATPRGRDSADRRAFLHSGFSRLESALREAREVAAGARARAAFALAHAGIRRRATSPPAVE
ncbi:MAG TPA: hypothetical protein VF529_22055 [Solirubrobacteraceae bacterium]|jgi:hypothetical protein